jgi:5,10-methenyltetrahydrofolate synthetase
MTWDEIKTWRKAKRAELIERRVTSPHLDRAAWNERITAHLAGGFEIPAESVVGFCWPFKGEFDARHAVRRWREQGALAALPEVVAKSAPLVFRAWWPGAPMRPGVYDIPVPNGTAVVTPDFAIVPMNGVDRRGYRLGYGGGFFDRTLAALDPRPIAIGVTYEMLQLETIHPQPHDIPMDFVVTESGIHAAGGEALQLIDPAECRRRTVRLLAGRRLPRHAVGSDGYSSPVCYASEFRDYWTSEAAEEKPNPK